MSLQKVESDINYEAIITSLRLFSDLLLSSSDISEDVLKLYLVLLLHLPDDYVSSLNIQIYLQFYNYLKEQVLQGNTIFQHFLYEFVKKFCLILCEYLNLEQEIKNLLFSFNRILVKVATYLINYLNSLVKKILNKQKFNFNKGHRSMSEDNSCISDYMQFIEEKWKREEQLVNKINFDNLKINEFSERFCDLLFSKENLNIDEIQAALVFFEEIKNPPSQVSLQSFMNWMSLISNDLIYQIKLVRILTRWFGFTIYPEYSTIIKKIHENEIPLIRKSATSREYLRLLKIVAKYTRKSIFKLENDNEIYINTAAILWKSIKPITDRKFDFHKRKTPWKMIRYVSMYLIDTLTRSFNKVYFQEIEKILQLAYTHDILQKFKEEEEDIENKLFSLLMAHLDEIKDNVVEWVYYISSHISSTQYHEIEAPLIFLYRINEEIPGIINESNIEVMMPRNYHSMNYSSTEEIEKNKNLLLDFFSCADGEIEDKLCDLVKKVYPYRNGSHR
ncbi:hypothetical protein TRFO_34481 [Tritrichomonas foetus]|uniref:Uncharacterized protein n=1 Tax=Tritrichomonas foetus TaxID=1144522 RepID=A0A1J4JPD1_9EUKA|nr:hypothetical protein TRFO_34481 [Tritrichomonas foetus]|eukprot:OHS99132.1 hypothetical protein TRFO_34481 [Tritrichomonas foetus]